MAWPFNDIIIKKMPKMPPAIFTGTVFGLLQSFGLGAQCYLWLRTVVVRVQVVGDGKISGVNTELHTLGEDQESK